MTQTYQPATIEPKWQKKWRDEKLYQTEDNSSKPKYYVLDMFPYPSGAGLHVGHPKGYIATDVVARQKMMAGFNVLHPMGWDAFGLPAENYALKNKVHPAESTAANIKVFKQQLEKLGFTYDWEREVNTTDPAYYRWTQWIFLQMYQSYYDERAGRARPITHLIEQKFGTDDYHQLSPEQKKEIDAERLAFEDLAPINWCPSCKTGLANEDLEDGRCERCGSLIEKKPLRQWNLRITKYADRLLADLATLDWEPAIKLMQTNWIGRSEGASFQFELQSGRQKLPVEIFTTRADTIFGATYLVLAPELVAQLLADNKITVQNRDQVTEYLEQAQQQTEIERTDEKREKTGVKLEGVVAINPVSGAQIPVFAADYVLADYGTGAIMAVPAHDQRDGEFAQKFNLPIMEVVRPAKSKKSTQAVDVESALFTSDGILTNSGKYDGLTSAQARAQIVADFGRPQVNYKLRDWVFSRQRYWGEPIPIIHCPHCGTVNVPEADLPVKLPVVESYEPSGTGESPLVKITDWVEVDCPICGAKAKRETNTMPQWAGSSWYYLRYLDPHNDRQLVDPAKEQVMMPVDFYVGGAEHATRHLIYARFYHKFLYDLGVVSTPEPFSKLQHVGLILAEDGRKMSKRWGNVINPDEIVAQYGADSLRVYEMFMGPFAAATAWNTQGVVGVHKFLQKVWQLQERVDAKTTAAEREQYLSLLHQIIGQVTDEIATFKLNTVVSSLMILTNKLQTVAHLAPADYEILLQLLAPMAPHLAEEVWARLGHHTSIFRARWPVADPQLAQATLVVIPVQINGKLREQLTVARAMLEQQEQLLQLALSQPKIKKYLEGRELVKKIYIPGKIINLVVK